MKGSVDQLPHPLEPTEEVREALAEGHPVVALETSVLAQGLPPPRNEEAAGAMASEILERGALPAWIWVGGGRLRIGARPEELAVLCRPRAAAKVSRRELPMALAGVGVGGTTVSAALWAADRAGIDVLATGGIGGVHRGTGDVSADLIELSRTPGMVVCSGPKSIVDLMATTEKLEELGIAVVGYRCDRMPFFVARDSGVELEHRADSPSDLASLARAATELGSGSAIVVCQPAPEEHALPPEEVADAVRKCERLLVDGHITGKDVTPFMLSCLSRHTEGRSLEANLALLRANAALSAEIASVLATG